MRRHHILLSYQRGSWAPGSKHQKHMSMNPTQYLYRFPGPSGPGPYTMKYWWTLGCFPTGIEIPFRLKEFLATYQQEHVPLEVEEWLQCFVKDPFMGLQEATTELLAQLEEAPVCRKTRGYMSINPSASQYLSPLKKFEKHLGISIPVAAVRATLGTPSLHNRLKDELFEYSMSLEESGSTHHRRLARLSFEETEPLSELPQSAEVLQEMGASIPPHTGQLVGTYASPHSTTAPDEKNIIRFLTTCAEGSAIAKQYDVAYSILSSALKFSHDDDTDSIIHCNASSAALLDGRFKEAEFHGRQSALLEPQPRHSGKEKGRGYALWASAVAYQDDFERAGRIVEDGLSVHSASEDLQSLHQSLSSLSSRSVPPSLRGVKAHTNGQQKRALLHGSGKSFDNEFDWIVFKNKLYPNKMDPSSNEMGSVFRRVGDLGGHISTSRSSELL